MDRIETIKCSCLSKKRYFVQVLITGETFLKLQKQEDAITDFTKSIEQDPKYTEAYQNRGRYSNYKQVKRIWQ